jgi:hypothetical protein
MSVEDLTQRAESIAAAAEDEANALLAEDRFKEAKVVLANAQRELRDVKREATEEQRQVREAAADERLKISNKGQTLGMFGGSKVRGAMAHGRAAAKRDLAQRQADALRPYDYLKSAIDRGIAQMDRAKAEITADMSEQKSTGATPKQASHAPAPAPTLSPPPPPPTPAQWAKDPGGRHELRWWDGTRWTEHVANAGVTSIDPPTP